MATTDRDYYELLGVARDASETEIKRAFRQLARELHPDVSEAPDADERFREVVEAYEVLSKSETRDLYDRYGHAGLRGGGSEENLEEVRHDPRFRFVRGDIADAAAVEALANDVDPTPNSPPPVPRLNVALQSKQVQQVARDAE